MRVPVILVVVTSLVAAPILADVVEKEVEEPQTTLIEDASAKAEAAAEANINKGKWFAAGCFLNLVGVVLASAAETEPPESHILGKPPEYTEAFAEAYRKRAKYIRAYHAGAGCLISSAIIAGCIIFGKNPEICCGEPDLGPEPDDGECAEPDMSGPSPYIGP